jgi:hypothetical protein
MPKTARAGEAGGAVAVEGLVLLLGVAAPPKPATARR